VAGHQVGQRVGVEQRDVAGRDDNDTAEIVGQRRQATQHRVAGAELLVLRCRVDRAPKGFGQFTDRVFDAPVITAEHHHQVLRRHLGDRMQRMCQHAAAGQGVQHFRGIRAHPGAGPGRQDEDR
jgi:hypothetical protein